VNKLNPKKNDLARNSLLIKKDDGEFLMVNRLVQK
jgi:hypothetical protein